MATLVVITDAARALPTVRWAAWFHKFDPTSTDQFYILPNVSFPSDTEGEKVPAELPGESAMCRAAREVFAPEITCAVEVIRTETARSAAEIAELIEEREVKTTLVGCNAMLKPTSPQGILVERLFRATSSLIVALDPGHTSGERRRRVVVSVEGPVSEFALKACVLFASNECTIVPTIVGLQFGEDAEEIAQRELAFEMREAGLEPSAYIKPRVVLAQGVERGIAEASSDADIAFLGIPAYRDLRRLRIAVDAAAEEAGTPAAAVATFRPTRRRKERIVPAAATPYLEWLPQLGAEERAELFDRIQAGTRWSADFVIMIGLSTAIATMGLLQSSTAVVIGAMVVAPLMTPLIGAGLALVQGNVRLFRNSVRTMFLGVFTGLLLSVVISKVVPGESLTMEVTARGMPTMLDLVVAFISGIAAGYALARPNVVAALAGVAIAAALVPPLASVGIALGSWQLKVAEGAGILLLTNLVAIILGAGAIFRAMGVRGSGATAEPHVWLRRCIIGLVLMLALLSAPLGYRLADQLAEGQVRPLAFPVSGDVYAAIKRVVDREPELDLILAGRASDDPEAEKAPISVLLSSTRSISPYEKRELAELIRTVRGKDVPVRVFFVSDAVRPAGAPKAKE